MGIMEEKSLKYKLLALDIDGTLLNSKHKITKNVNKALNKAKEKYSCYSCYWQILR